MDEPSVIHIYIRDKLRDNCTPYSSLLKRYKVKSILCKSRIPQVIHNKFLEELEEYGFIQFNNRKSIRIL
jgi:hypothetical protein